MGFFDRLLGLEPTKKDFEDFKKVINILTVIDIVPECVSYTKQYSTLYEYIFTKKARDTFEEFFVQKQKSILNSNTSSIPEIARAFEEQSADIFFGFADRLSKGNLSVAGGTEFMNIPLYGTAVELFCFAYLLGRSDAKNRAQLMLDSFDEAYLSMIKGARKNFIQKMEIQDHPFTSLFKWSTLSQSNRQEAVKAARMELKRNGGRMLVDTGKALAHGLGEAMLEKAEQGAKAQGRMDEFRELKKNLKQQTEQFKCKFYGEDYETRDREKLEEKRKLEQEKLAKRKEYIDTELKRYDCKVIALQEKLDSFRNWLKSGIDCELYQSKI